MSTSADPVGVALRAVLDVDAGFATAPARLERAMLDLLPYDERAGRLVALAASLGIPELVSTDRAVEGRQRLFDEAGLRPELADWLVAVWQQATGTPANTARWGALRTSGAAAHPVTEQPGSPTALRIAVWPDGAVLAAVVTADGVFAAAVPMGTPPVWRRVAKPAAPSSRDVAICLDGTDGVVSWTDATGVAARAVAPEQAGGLSLSEPRTIVAGEPARYPLAVVATGPDVLDVLWTSDRSALRRAVLRAWAVDPESGDVPGLDRAGERFTGLDAVRDGDRSVWLAACTDRGRVLVTRWDLALDDIAAWVPVAAPSDVASVSVVALRGGCVLVCGLAGGPLVAVDAADAVRRTGAWQTVRKPDGVGEGPPRLVAGAGHDGRGWLAVTDSSGTWLAPAGRRGTEVVLGPARTIGLGG